MKISYKSNVQSAVMLGLVIICLDSLSVRPSNAATLSVADTE